MRNIDFYKGMDISFLPEYEDGGMTVYDLEKNKIDVFELLKRHGVNSIRLRIWHTPSNVPESKGYCSLEQTIAMAKRIVEQDMSFMLDFHYSDFWADPGQQNKPKAWEGLTFEELKTAVYEYTRETLLTMKKEGVLPDIVQIGNEIRSGLLFPDGQAPHYKEMVQLINSGIEAARSVATAEEMKVMIHLDQGGRYFYLKDWFSNAFEAGLMDFDWIGLSYYPFWHGTFTDLKNTMQHLIDDYGKPIMIVETAHAWRRSASGFIDEAQEKIAGFKATPEGQRQVLDLVSNIVASLPDNMGKGFYYWEPICIPKGEGWAENMGILDEAGNVMECIHSFEFVRDQVKVKEIAKVYELPKKTLKIGEVVTLPSECTVLLYNGDLDKRRIEWLVEDQNLVYDTVGEYCVTGKIKGEAYEVTQEFEIVEEYVSKENLLTNTNWDDGLYAWKVECDANVMYQIYPEFDDPFPAPPVNAIRVEGKSNFSYRLSQDVALAVDGEYCLEIEMQGTDTTGVEINLFVETKEQRYTKQIHATEHGYEIYTLDNMLLKEGVVFVGVDIVSSPMYIMMRKLKFTKK